MFVRLARRRRLQANRARGRVEARAARRAAEDLVEAFVQPIDDAARFEVDGKLPHTRRRAIFVQTASYIWMSARRKR